jgi:hypothetical protein
MGVWFQTITHELHGKLTGPQNSAFGGVELL